MDKLGNLKYENESLLYQYKGLVSVPALEMGDDIENIQKCGADALISNAAINLFVEHMKLTLNAEKFHKIHCGAKRSTCPNLKIHKQNMHETDKEKYLGDNINKYGKHGSTIANRRA